MRSIDLDAARPAGPREWTGLAVLVLACVVYAMDLSVLHLAVPSLSADLRPSSAQLLWIIDIYGFLVAGSLITMGTLGDRIGRRRLLMIGAAAFCVTSVIAALSSSAAMLIAARALMGIAGATLAPSTLSLIFSMFRNSAQRATAIGVWVSGFSAGGAIGPVLGGVVIESAGWGAVFLLALPVMGLLLILGPRVLPEFRNPRAGRLDLASAGLSLAAILTVILGLKQMAQDGFGPLPAAAIAAGAALGALFVRRQARLQDPFVDLRLFRITSFSAALAANLLGVFVAFGYFLFVAQYLQLVRGLSPLQAGLLSLPSAAAFIVSSNAAPPIMRGLRPHRVLAACFAAAAVALASLLLVTPTSGIAILVAASIVISLALAPAVSLTTNLIVGSAPPEQAGAASAVSETGAEVGGAVGIAVLGSVGTAVSRAVLATRLPEGVPPEAAEAARETLGAAVEAAGRLPAEMGAALLEAARDGFVGGLHVAAAVSAAAALAAAVIAAALLRDAQPAPDASPAEADVAGDPDLREAG